MMLAVSKLGFRNTQLVGAMSATGRTNSETRMPNFRSSGPVITICRSIVPSPI